MSKDRKALELVKGKSRKEEEKFYETFSKTQLNAVLLIILAATFLVQGVTRYLELINLIEVIKPWLLITISSIATLILSIILLALSGVTARLRIKRAMNLLSFIFFILGIIIFLISLFFLAYQLY